jgi:hypothetical protein
LGIPKEKGKRNTSQKENQKTSYIPQKNVKKETTLSLRPQLTRVTSTLGCGQWLPPWDMVKRF